MSSKHWFAAAAAVLLVGFLTSSAQAAPIGVSRTLKHATVSQSDVQNVHWRRHWHHRWHRHYYYYGGYRPYYYYGGYPRYYGGYPYYGYGGYPYYGSGFSFYGRGFAIHIGRRWW